MGRIRPILGIASASFLVALGVYCFARIYPPEIITPLQATHDLLAVHSDVFGSAPSLFYTLAVGLIIGAFASTPTNAKVHCLIWISLTMILEASQHPAVAEPIASWLAETLDQSASAEWGCIGTSVGTSVQDGAVGVIGAGATNTAKILAGCPTAGIAARLTDNYSLNGYSDWYLPSTNELEQLWPQRNVVGGFAIGGYWSSQETVAADRAWIKNFLTDGTNGNGSGEAVDKNLIHHVRAIRSF